MKNIKITFRLTPQKLAFALQIVRKFDSTYKLISINDLVKTFCIKCLNKYDVFQTDEVLQNTLEEILTFADKSAEAKLTIDDLMNIKKVSTEDLGEIKNVLSSNL